MSDVEVDRWAQLFEEFHGRFAGLFPRPEPREQSAKYLRGLLGDVRRKNGWQMAEAVGDETPDRTQRLLYRASWDADAVLSAYRRFVIEEFGASEGIGVVDETGFLKKGTKSAGVQRQYTGTAGKKENCQIGVFLTYTAHDSHVFLDRRLYLPEVWTEDEERRREAKIPAEVKFRTKPQLGIEMLREAWDNGVPMKWVTADEVYGNSPEFRSAIDSADRHYVVAVASTTPVWTERPEVLEPGRGASGRRRKVRRVADDAEESQEVRDLVKRWDASSWKRLTVSEGEKGPIAYDWGWQRVVEKRNKLPGPDVWLLARRSISNPDELAYYLCHAPEHSTMLDLACVASTRHTIEQCFEEGKGETGLDEYEVRYWHSWYRHITLSMMAHGFLALLRREAMGEEKKRWTTSWQN
jgi:SRSO17 transposase